MVIILIEKLEKIQKKCPVSPNLSKFNKENMTGQRKKLERENGTKGEEKKEN